MKTNLEVGDIVVVSTALSGIREYPVLEINGNKAKTAFRTFHRKIYNGSAVYEYGKRLSAYDNGYWVKEEEPE